jgi:hypothetical protein
MLRRQNWKLVTDVSKNPSAPIFEGQAVIDYPKMSVTNNQSTLHNIPEQRKFHLHRSGSLKSGKIFPYLGAIMT